MATRKQPVTKPSLTRDEKKAQKEINKDRTEKALSDQDFDHYVRFLKKSSLDKIEAAGHALEKAIKDLKVKRSKKTPPGIPEGSDQVDCGTLIRWIESIQSEHTKAVDQLIVLDAVVCQRSG